MKQNFNHKTLILITGPTAVGKTETSIEIASRLQTEILSADARQFYRETVIGTAAPSSADLEMVKHHFIGNLSIHDYYNVSHFEQQAMAVLQEIFQKSDYAVLTGGSGLYIDTLCRGIDFMPDISTNIRAIVQQLYKDQGIEGLRIRLQEIDPEYFAAVDLHNPNRMMRGIEIFMATGQKYSSLRRQLTPHRPFKIKKIILNLPRHQLYERINIRTQQMVQEGIIEEAIMLFRYQHLNALNTVGYKELFAWLENRWNLSTAVEKIKINTRRYAKRQITWFKRYDDARWYLPEEKEAILRFISE